MESAYFTPDIEDFYVGYEFQGKVYGEEDTWVNCVYSRPTDEMFCKDSDDNIWVNDSLRVPYLTKEQIEAEGWKYLAVYGSDKNDDYTIIFEKKTDKYKYELSFHSYNTLILIEQLRETQFKTVRENFFKGDCKDINTFRKICKLLGI